MSSLSGSRRRFGGVEPQRTFQGGLGLRADRMCDRLAVAYRTTKGMP
jgi:hypothetical protein